jgi:hypothetical protein
VIAEAPRVLAITSVACLLGAIACAPRLQSYPRIQTAAFGLAMFVCGVNLGISWANWAMNKLFKENHHGRTGN